MRDLNYQLKELCRKNRDGSYATLAQRLSLLTLRANKLHELGYRQLDAQSLKPKHVEALVKHWLSKDLAIATMKNRMSVLRWWAEKVGRQNVIARTIDHYGIPERQFVTNISKAQNVNNEALSKVCDNHVRMSLEHAKVMAIVLRKQIKSYESQTGVDIQLPQQVYQQLGISKQEDW